MPCFDGKEKKSKKVYYTPSCITEMCVRDLKNSSEKFFDKCSYWFQLSSIVAEQTLEAVGAKGMVVGHTPQMHGVNWYPFLLISISDLI